MRQVLGYQATRIAVLDRRLLAAYDVLGVRPGADAEAVRRAFRRIAKRSHPDVSRRADATERFQRALTAYRAITVSVAPARIVTVDAAVLPTQAAWEVELRRDLKDAVLVSLLCFVVTLGVLELAALVM